MHYLYMHSGGADRNMMSDNNIGFDDYRWDGSLYRVANGGG